MPKKAYLQMNRENLRVLRRYSKKGDKVITSQYSGTKIKFEGEELIIVKQNDILAIVE